MDDEKQDDLIKIINRLPAVGVGLLLLFVFGVFVIIMLVSPLKTTWVYDRAIFALTYALGALPMVVAWIGIITIGAFAIDALVSVRKAFEYYIRTVVNGEKDEAEP